MRGSFAARSLAVFVFLALALLTLYSALFVVYQTDQALVVRLGQLLRVVTQAGLNFKVPLIDGVIYIDNRILDLENPAQEVIASDQTRLVIDAFARYRITDALKFYQTIVLVAQATAASEQVRGDGDAARNRIYAAAYPEFFAFYRSMQAYENALPAGNTRLLLTPDSEFSATLATRRGRRADRGS